MQTIPVKVSDTKYKKASDYSRTLIKYYKLTCTYKKDSCVYTGELSIYKSKQLKKFCESKKIKFEIDTKYGKRSNTYRNIFFKNVNPPFFNRYFCVYCGRILSKEQVTVDHLFPVGEVNKNIRLQKKLKKMGAKSVNDYQNLVPSCKKCNNKKGSKMGIWIIKGRIGRYQKLWLIRWTVRIIVASMFISSAFILYSMGLLNLF